MDVFPMEILLTIFEFIEKVDLKYLRQDINWWMWAAAVQPWISSTLEQIEFTPDWYTSSVTATKPRTQGRPRLDTPI
jgi:hypothetical protein